MLHIDDGLGINICATCEMPGVLGRLVKCTLRYAMLCGAMLCK